MELIRTEMTPKERMTKYMAGEKVDRKSVVGKEC